METKEDAKEWYDVLHEKYHHLFCTFEGEETERSYYKKGQILRGIECGRAWEWIVEQFLKTLEWLTENRRYVDNPNWDEDGPSSRENPRCIEGPKVEIKVFQIKEKFGELRIYMNDYPKRINGDIEKAIGRAEARAELTCYSCGTVTKDLITTPGWVTYICKDCMEKRNAKRSDDGGKEQDT